jgi:hypothetical protein
MDTNYNAGAVLLYVRAALLLLCSFMHKYVHVPHLVLSLNCEVSNNATHSETESAALGWVSGHMGDALSQFLHSPSNVSSLKRE